MLILTDRRLMRVRIDGSGAVVQLSQTANRQIGHARAEDFRDRASVTVELGVGSTIRLDEADPAEARRFIATVAEVAARFRR